LDEILDEIGDYGRTKMTFCTAYLFSPYRAINWIPQVLYNYSS